MKYYSEKNVLSMSPTKEEEIVIQIRLEDEDGFSKLD